VRSGSTGLETGAGACEHGTWMVPLCPGCSLEGSQEGHLRIGDDSVPVRQCAANNFHGSIMAQPKQCTGGWGRCMGAPGCWF
jgi:hypothetical protein